MVPVANQARCIKGSSPRSASLAIPKGLLNHRFYILILNSVSSRVLDTSSIYLYIIIHPLRCLRHTRLQYVLTTALQQGLFYCTCSGPKGSLSLPLLKVLSHSRCGLVTNTISSTVIRTTLTLQKAMILRNTLPPNTRHPTIKLPVPLLPASMRLLSGLRTTRTALPLER